MNKFLTALLAFVCISVEAQNYPTSYFNQGLLRQQSAAQDIAYLGITQGGGSGTVTTISVGGLTPLFLSTVLNPTTTPSVSFTPISQSQNLFYASPNGASGTPTFRAIVAADLPGGGSGTVTTFSSGNLSPLFTTSVATPTTTPAQTFAQISQNQNLVFASPDGASGNPTFRSLVANDIPVLAYVTSIASSGGTVSLINSGSEPVPLIKGLTAGANVTLTDNGSSVTIASTGGGGGGGGSGVDITMTNTTPYANGTNYYIDLAWQANTIPATNSIAFQYTTNWPGSTSTSRVASVFIPATNYLRKVFFLNAATNWRISSPVYCIPPMRGAKFVFQMYGVGETNVNVVPSIDAQNAGNIPQITNVTNVVTSATNIATWDASRDVYHDNALVTLASEGEEIRGWKDESANAFNLTNFTATYNSIIYRNSQLAPFNIPAVEVRTGGAANTWLKTKAIATLTQPVYVFMMCHTSLGSETMLDGASGATTARLVCGPSNGGNTGIASENASSFNTATGFVPGYVLYTFVFNGASSSIRTNAVQAGTGSLVNTTATAITFGSDISATAPTEQPDFAEIQVWWGALSSTDLGNIETNYFRAKYQTW